MHTVDCQHMIFHCELFGFTLSLIIFVCGSLCLFYVKINSIEEYEESFAS
jgi:hypothetical protein